MPSGSSGEHELANFAGRRHENGPDAMLDPASTSQPPLRSTGGRLSVEPKPKDWDFAREIYRRFQAKPGSEHIATEQALAYLSALLDAAQPKVVLEMGAGIGTITDALLLHPARPERIVAAEQNDYCLSVLRGNLTNSEDRRLVIASKPEEVPPDLVFDLVVGDGGFGVDGHYVTFSSQLRPGTIVFAEGNRIRLRKALTKDLKGLGRSLEMNEIGVEYKRRWRPSTRLESLGIKVPLYLKTRVKCCWLGVVS
jgi:predicted O-methyltransferase YrrM